MAYRRWTSAIHKPFFCRVSQYCKGYLMENGFLNLVARVSVAKGVANFSCCDSSLAAALQELVYLTLTSYFPANCRNCSKKCRNFFRCDSYFATVPYECARHPQAIFLSGVPCRNCRKGNTKAVPVTQPSLVAQPMGHRRWKGKRLALDGKLSAISPSVCAMLQPILPHR